VSGTSRLAVGLVCAGIALACVGPHVPPPVPVVATWREVDFAPERTLAIEAPLRERSDALHAKVGELDLLFADPLLAAYLDRVLAIVLEQSGGPLPDAVPAIEIHVMRATFRNAFVDAAGRIYLTTALLASIENEAQLAALFGHEIAHFMSRDAYREELYRKVTDSTVDRTIHSRARELEADRRALEWTVGAGYPASEVGAVLRRLEDGAPPRRDVVMAWESHPNVRERVRALHAHMRELGIDVGENIEGEDRKRARAYEQPLPALLRENVEVELGEGRVDAAWTCVERWVALAPESAEAHHAKGRVAALRDAERRRSPTVAEEWERALELDPQHRAALRDLGLLLCPGDGCARGRELLGRYLELEPDAFDRKLIERVIGEGNAAR